VTYATEQGVSHSGEGRRLVVEQELRVNRQEPGMNERRDAMTRAAEPMAGGDRTDCATEATEAFVAHRNLLFTVAYEMLGSAADAEDVLQETWLRWV